MVIDIRITHERFDSSSDPSLNGHLNYPNDIDRSLNETTADKIRKYQADYNNIITITLTISPLCRLLLVRPGGYIVTCCAFNSYKLIGKLTAFLQLQEFSLRNLPVDSYTSVAWRSPHNSSLRSQHSRQGCITTNCLEYRRNTYSF